MKDNWTDKLPSLMEGYQEVPPEGLWDAVQAGVASPIVPWWPWAAGLAAAAAAVLLAVFLWNPVPEAIKSDSSVAARLADVPVEVLEVPVEAPAQMQIAPEVHLEESKTEPQVQTEPETHLKEEQPGEKPSVKPAEEPEPVQWIEQPATTAPRKKPFRGKITVTSGGALLAQGASGVSQGYGIPSNPGMTVPSLPAVKSVVNAQLLSRNRPSTTEVTHRQILRLSVGVNYNFAPRWRVGTGLSYSVLESHYVTTSGTAATENKRRLTYLGIPLNLQYALLETNRFSLYLSAGPMVEAAVDCQNVRRSYLGQRVDPSREEDLPCDDWRWSLNAGAGFEFKAFRNAALYVQPGLVWHLPGPSSVESIYTARPFVFALDFGLRWTL